MPDTIIETGVDKLIKLIEKRKRIAIDEAADILTVSIKVLQEWADFLEEEGMISVEYKLTKTYLVEKKVTPKELEAKAKEFHGKKEVFIRRVEGALRAIETDTGGLTKIRKEFSELQTMVSSEIDRIKEKLLQLMKYETLKKNIDRQILDQHKEFREKMARLDKEIINAQKGYQDIVHDIQIEKTKLKEEKMRVDSLKVQEDKLRERLKVIEDIAGKVKSQINEEDEGIGKAESRITGLQTLAKEIGETIGDKQAKVKGLIEESKEQEQKILKLQEDVLAEISQKESMIKKDMINTEDVTRRFENFFKRKNEIDALLDKIMIDRDNLRRDLNSIVKAAFAFELSSKSGSTKVQVTELEKKFGELDRKRGIFKRELEQLKKLILS